MKTLTLAASIFCLALPALAQTTTTVTSPPPADPAPQASRSTTGTATPAPAQPTAGPSDAAMHGTVRVDDEAVGVQTTHTTRPALAIVGADAVYGGLAGAVLGGGVALLDQGSHWQRDLTVGAGAGLVAGAAFGVYEAATTQDSRTRVLRADADRDPAAHDTGLSLSAFSTKF